MSNEDKPRRDSDEMSIASDFSIIPESFTGQEDISPGDQKSMASGMTSYRSDHFEVFKETGQEDISPGDQKSMASGMTSYRSEQFQPSLTAETSFGKVLFQNVQATYTADSDIAVSYVLTTSVSAKSSDRVALYRVGFGSPQDYLTYQWAPTPTKDHSTNQLPLTVVFKASALPKDAGEFFQFCYVTHESQIVGVSTPFQLHPVGSLGVNNVCGVDDGEDGMVVVCTKESVLHDKINKLSEENKKISVDLSNAQTTLEEKQREIEDKGQQLTMCQHHLQALEAKMKKETAEKCELMGRVGQVVEEKGHLEDRVKTFERNLEGTHAQIETLGKLLDKVKEEKISAEEEALQLRKHREQLEHALQKCQSDLSTAEENLQTLHTESERVRSERDAAVKDLEFWTSSAAADKNEKNSLALKFSTINEELINKLEELEKNKKLVRELEEKLTTVVIEMTSHKDKLTETKEKLNKAEEERTIHEERQNVVNQDNEQLKATIQQLKNRIEQLENVQENEESGREAAERIASDLSGRLQTAKAEYQALALTNLRLVKKIKKLRQSVSPEKLSTMVASVSSQGSSWLNVDDGGVDNDDGEELDEAAATGVEVASSMIQSCTSAITAASCSNCSHSTQQLSEAVHQKMEDIVRELSLQIQSLKTELKARQEHQEIVLSLGDVGSRQESNISKSEERQLSMENRQEEHQAESSQEVGQSEQGESSVDAQGEALAENNADQQVLYSNSFLPAQRTAPVFLPERERQATPNVQDSGNITVRPSAPSPTPSMLSQRGQSGGSPPVMIVSTSVSGSNLVVPQAHLPTTQPISGSILPPPLLPETTPTARQAAVMSQFTSQQIGHESDDDDFHSTSDNDDTTNISHDHSTNLLECPMCGLSFQPGAIRLLEEHINSHLEHVCPVCSKAFQRNNSKKFEDHVHAHFSDELPDDDNPLDDSSGPWGPAYRATRLLEID